MARRPARLKIDNRVLIFGGPYSNLQGTEAVLAAARRLKIAREHIICTGDMAAYCGDPVATIDLVRGSGIHAVMGNCDEQLATSADDCACGFPSDSMCERLSSAWFAYANAAVRTEQREWLARLPRRIDLEIGGRRLAVVHGSVSAVNRFVFATTPLAVKRDEMQLAACDGVIGGHCGLPFTEIVDGRLWHNAGVIGMPANDGTSRVWFSVLGSTRSGLKIEHRAIVYDHAAAAGAMRKACLPSDYRVALASGLWPSCDVLPAREAREQGVPLKPASVLWRSIQDKARRAETRLLWPKPVGGAEPADAAERGSSHAGGSRGVLHAGRAG
jgi:predicted phosphodiesterase